MDFDIDTAKAASWQKEVKQELEEVKQLLNEVAKSCAENPADDGILKVIEETGKVLEEDWTILCNVFDQSVDLIGDGIRTIIEAIERGQQVFEDFKNKR